VSKKKGLVTCVIGIKSDKNQNRQISVEEIQEFSRQECVPYFGEVSALTGENIPEFISFLAGLFSQYKDSIDWTII